MKSAKCKILLCILQLGNFLPVYVKLVKELTIESKKTKSKSLA